MDPDDRLLGISRGMDCRNLPGATQGQILASLLPAGGEVGGIEDLAMAGAKTDRQTECAVLQTIEPTVLAGLQHQSFSKIR
jgi:hypothetical protein